jgi:hypothetical protein
MCQDYFQCVDSSQATWCCREPDTTCSNPNICGADVKLFLATGHTETARKNGYGIPRMSVGDWFADVARRLNADAEATGCQTLKSLPNDTRASMKNESHLFSLRARPHHQKE